MAACKEVQLEEFKDAFKNFDDLGDGKIPQSQVIHCLRALGQNPSKLDVHKCFQQLKPHKRVSFEVFLEIYHEIAKARSDNTSDDIVEGLSQFDKDSTGFISSAELRKLLTESGEKMTDEEVDQLFAYTEVQDGKINYEEFVRKVMNG